MIQIATTGIWKIDSNLNTVIKYTTNTEKTENYEYKGYQDLHKVIDYIEASYKTEKQYYITGINCNPQTVLEEMLITKEAFNKLGGIQGFHAFQSFKEDEVTPEQCHEIGVKLAKEMWGDRFELVVSTHLNTNHLHNHFVINSVSFVDGKRYYDKRETYAELRKLSDLLCEEYGLSTIEEKVCKRSKIDFRNYQRDDIKRDNYYTTAKEDLDRAIGMAESYYDFEDLLKAMDYELIYRADKLSIRRSPYKKNIRIERYFGSDYSIERIKERIAEEHRVRVPFVNTHYKPTKPANYYRNRKPKGIQALYIHYCYLLKVFPRKYPYQKLSPTMRLEVRKMEQISEEMKLLVRNKLKTNEQFSLYKNEKEKQLDELTDKRKKLWYRHKKAKTEAEKQKIKKEIDSVNDKFEPIRKEVVLCNSIIMRSQKMQENLLELSDENQNRKEVDKNEYIR